MIKKKDDIFSVARKRMIHEQIIRRGISAENVLKTMSCVRRHDFVDEALVNQAYTDAPLSIGEGQTISQPYIVALMSQSLLLTGSEKVLEIGTGCGYQTVILAQMCKKVHTIERFKSLAMMARQRFKEYSLKNIVMRVGDGSLGWKEAAPFDRILISCVSPEIPKNLVNQLAPNGILVMPCSKKGEQHLLRITKQGNQYQTEDLGECCFVRMVGKYGYRRS